MHSRVFLTRVLHIMHLKRTLHTGEVLKKHPVCFRDVLSIKRALSVILMQYFVVFAAFPLQECCKPNAKGFTGASDGNSMQGR